MTTKVKSKRIYILNNAEIETLYALPHFTSEEREVFFALDETERNVLETIDHIPTKIHFILSLGHFKAKQRFFQYNHSSIEKDVKCIITPILNTKKFFF